MRLSANTMAEYDAPAYWADLHERDDLSTVGQSGLPTSMNKWLYRLLERRLRLFVDRHSLSPKTVYEVGAGTGYWVRWWQSRGAAVDGADLVPAAAERLARRFGGNFETLDISNTAPVKRYDLVVVFNVLLHVTDDASFAQALRNIASAVAPGGRLLLVEPIQTAAYRLPARPGASSRARPASAYLDPLVASGLDLVELTPAFGMGADPIEGGSRLGYRMRLAAWRLLKGPARLWAPLGNVMGAIVYAADPLILRTLGGRSSKFALLQRVSPPPGDVFDPAVGA
jgi:SAM-dependent methyltransferase